MTRSVLTWMLVAAVCLHPAVHLLAELGRLIGGGNAVSEPPPPPPPEARAAATKRREAAVATANALLRGPARPDPAEGVEPAARPVAKLLDVAGEFLGAMDDAAGGGAPRPAVRDGLNGEVPLQKLVEDRKKLMADLVAARKSFGERYGDAELNKLVMHWVAACKTAEDSLADPEIVSEKLREAASAYDRLAEDWRAKKQTLDGETSKLGKTWGEVRGAFEKLATKQGVGPLVAFAKLHESVDNDEDRKRIRDVAQKWVERWLPEEELPLDPDVKLYEERGIGGGKPHPRATSFIVYKANPKVAVKLRYAPREGTFAEFDLESGPKAETVHHISRTGNAADNDSYRAIGPTEWSRVADAYNRGRIRKPETPADGDPARRAPWTLDELDAWGKALTEDRKENNESLPSLYEIVMRRDKTSRGGKDEPSREALDKIVLAYRRASALFDCLKNHEECKVLFPNPPRPKEKRP